MTNIVLIVGNVGADPVTRTTQGGTAITSISVATSRRYKNSAGETKEDTEWHRVTCFNGIGKAVGQYVRKGTKVSVQGRLHYSSWKDQDGNTRYGVEIYADEVNFLTRPKDAPAGDTGCEAPAGDAPGEDIPF